MGLRDELQHQVNVDMGEAQIEPLTRDSNNATDFPCNERPLQYCQNDLMLVYQVLLKAYIRGSEILREAGIESETP